jgi:hypothetical protein
LRRWLLRFRLRSCLRLRSWFRFRGGCLLLLGFGGRLFRRRLFGLRFGCRCGLRFRLRFRRRRCFGFRRLLFRFGRCRLLLARGAGFGGFAFGALGLGKHEGSVWSPW